MKRAICILLCFVFAFSLISCGSQPSDNSTGDTMNQSGDVSGIGENESKAPATKKVLVVYYSATGSTKAVAETIAKTVGGDLFEIVPAPPYTSADLNWRDDNSRVCLEYNDESKRDVPLTEAIPEHWEQYDTVYIGYPIWWGIAAWPVDGFIKANDFAGKTVIPFCTSSSSGIGNSGEQLRQAAGSGSWLSGKRFPSNTSESTVEEWLNERSEK